MQFDDTMLQKLEKLAMLRIDDDRREETMRELEKIVDFVEILGELETDGLDPAFSTLTSGTPMRDDTPHEDPEIRTVILRHAPDAHDDYFVVPAIIE